MDKCAVATRAVGVTTPQDDEADEDDETAKAALLSDGAVRIVVGVGKTTTCSIASPEAAGHEEVHELRERIDYLEKRNRSLQKQLNSRPIIFQAPRPGGVSNPHGADANAEVRPAWELRLRDCAAPVAQRLGFPEGWERCVSNVLALLCRKLEQPLGDFTQRMLKSRTLLWLFYLHLLVIYTMIASCFSQGAPGSVAPQDQLRLTSSRATVRAVSR